MYGIVFTKQAVKDLERLPEEVRVRIAPVIDLLAEDPRPSGCKKLKGGKNVYRIRVGHYRIIYTLEDDKLLIIIVRIGHRKDVYQ
jgi:mRNA interferase RelE/StbE